jgi:hypothetical protein
MGIETLFGGRVRTASLEALAMTPKPLSAYRVAKAADAEPIQVLTALKALEPDVVRHTDLGWILVNEPIRRFFRDEVCKRDAILRLEKDELLVQMGRKPRKRRGRK